MSISSESLCFRSCQIFFQGYTSDIQQLGHTAEMLRGKPRHRAGGGLEASLPKSFSCTGPGSYDIRRHGKSKPTNFTEWVLSRVSSVPNQNDFSIVGPQQQQPILVTCSWGSWRGENCQLQPGTTAEWDLRQQLVPDEDSSVFGLSIPQLPILPRHQELQLPYVPDCVSNYVIYSLLRHCEKDCLGTCSFLAV